MSNLVYHRQFPIEWGHCDPAGIVFNSRFFEFFDWSSWLLFEAALGVRPADLAPTFGIMGIPLVDARARFLKPAKFNDLADIVSEVAEFLDALQRVAGGATVLDPEVVGQLLVRRRRDDPLRNLTPREREVLALMAEGRSNTAIARKIVVTDGAVEKHVRNIFTKLDLPPDDEQHRRVLAVLAYLRT